MKENTINALGFKRYKSIIFFQVVLFVVLFCPVYATYKFHIPLVNELDVVRARVIAANEFPPHFLLRTDRGDVVPTITTGGPISLFDLQRVRNQTSEKLRTNMLMCSKLEVGLYKEYSFSWFPYFLVSARCLDNNSILISYDYVIKSLNLGYFFSKILSVFFVVYWFFSPFLIKIGSRNIERRLKIKEQNNGN